jgi:hypothetical protein
MAENGTKENRLTPSAHLKGACRRAHGADPARILSAYCAGQALMRASDLSASVMGNGETPLGPKYLS